MKKHVLYYIGLAMLINLFPVFVQAQINDSIRSLEVSNECVAMADSMAKCHDWVSFKLRFVRYNNNQFLFSEEREYTFHYGNNLLFYIDRKDIGTKSCLTKDYFKEIDDTNRGLSVFQNSETDTTNSYIILGLFNCILKNIMDIQYYNYPTIIGQFSPFPYEYSEQNIIQTKRGDYVEYIANLLLTDADDAERSSLTNYKFYIDRNTYLLDSIHAISQEGGSRYDTYYSLYDFDFEDKQMYIDSLFSFDNPKYKEYSRYDENNHPLKNRGSHNVKINDDILNFPLVKLIGDTTRVKNQNDWVLLNFWSFGCAPCIKNLQNYGHEKDSLGYRILENEDIKILAINYQSDNMELIKQMGEKTATSDIMYSAKGMNTLINIPYLGYYYLISPEREIVYETATLGDYSELLKAKQEYEKTHLNK